MSVTPLPEGVTATLNVYLVSSNGLEIRVQLGEFSQWPSPPKDIDVASIAATGILGNVRSGWRVMTRAEIADYQRRDDAYDDADDEGGQP